MAGRRSSAAARSRPSPIRSIRSMRWAGRAISAPVRLNWRDIRPIMSHRYHVPPSVHSTFVADRFVVCTFVPRPIESDPGALKVPFFHSNDDFDEVIFYHRGEFFSRDNIHPGMMTFHPCGFTHGPHPKAFAAGAKAAKTETDEVAVMIDARDALDMARAARNPRRRRTTPTAGRRNEARLAARRPRRRSRRRLARSEDAASPSRTSRRRCRPQWTTGTSARPGSMRVSDLLNDGDAEGGEAFRRGRMRGAPAARLSMGGRLGLCHACRTGAPGARRGDAAVLLDRSVDVSGRLGRLHRPARSDACRATKPGASISRAKSPSSPTMCRWACDARAAAKHIKLLMLVNDVSPAQSHPGRTRQEFRLLPVQAGDARFRPSR